MLLVSLLTLAAAQSAEAPSSFMTVTVKKLPAGFRQSPVVHLEFTGSGRVDKCEIEQPSGNAAIDRAACQQARQVRLKVENNVVPASRSAVITFTTDAG
jgi:TonB family protein